ncbi:hypothetical protein EJ05DRAFT_243553 [Pseudovirgaria hyperparasitica]|uniref:Ribosomal protein bL31m N-terminal domain-containing protein n=1 Tax=Pseudovirgaria hyperparasitica TaxID=470096 RepID=A0A6A6WF93_9PEZI|nr:uncharacterized protein EJ05DRAFT_243553 [Pseudovirgaria hyperparasitica]KAF2760829.1 hypothetical protein EJ05DRAFT_243553 [Pseudovirgaria hyperparasitica]
MSTLLSPASFGRISLRASTSLSSLPRTQVRHATIIKRPKRPYTFTQLVTLSDGSSYVHRTTSPKAVYVSMKDRRNSALWNPSDTSLVNLEVDEAGRLKAFRDKFGRGWDGQTDSGKEVRAQEHQVKKVYLT